MGNMGCCRFRNKMSDLLDVFVPPLNVNHNCWIERWLNSEKMTAARFVEGMNFEINWRKNRRKQKNGIKSSNH